MTSLDYTFECAKQNLGLYEKTEDKITVLSNASCNDQWMCVVYYYSYVCTYVPMRRAFVEILLAIKLYSCALLHATH